MDTTLESLVFLRLRIFICPSRFSGVHRAGETSDESVTVPVGEQTSKWLNGGQIQHAFTRESTVQVNQIQTVHSQNVGGFKRDEG